MKRLLLFCVIAFVLMAVDARGQESQADRPAPSAVSYDTFCKQDLATRKLSFAKMRPEDRAAIARTQLERWLGANLSNLTPQQAGAVRERIRTIKPVEFSSVIIEQDMARAKAFESPHVAFTRVQLDEMGLTGPCIPVKAG
jgi:hypothetical protein